MSHVPHTFTHTLTHTHTHALPPVPSVRMSHVTNMNESCHTYE